MYIEEKSSHFEVKEMCIWATYCVKLKKESSLCLGFISHKTGIIIETAKIYSEIKHTISKTYQVLPFEYLFS